VFCADCLAPHHADCFREYGRCSVHGCGGKQTVSPRDLEPTPQPAAEARVLRAPAKRRSSGSALALLLALVLLSLYTLVSFSGHSRRELRWSQTERDLQGQITQLQEELAGEHEAAVRQAAELDGYRMWVRYGGCPARVEALQLSGVYCKPSGAFAVFGHTAVPQGGELYVAETNRVWHVDSVSPERVVLRDGQQVVQLTFAPAASRAAH